MSSCTKWYKGRLKYDKGRGSGHPRPVRGGVAEQTPDWGRGSQAVTGEQSFSGRGMANAEEVCLACWRNSEKAPVAKAEWAEGTNAEVARSRSRGILGHGYGLRLWDFLLNPKGKPLENVDPESNLSCFLFWADFMGPCGELTIENRYKKGHCECELAPERSSQNSCSLAPEPFLRMGWSSQGLTSCDTNKRKQTWVFWAGTWGRVERRGPGTLVPCPLP